MLVGGCRIRTVAPLVQAETVIFSYFNYREFFPFQVFVKTFRSYCIIYSSTMFDARVSETVKTIWQPEYQICQDRGGPIFMLFSGGLREEVCEEGVGYQYPCVVNTVLPFNFFQ